MDTDPSGYTWKFIAQTQSAMWPYASGTNPYEQAALTVTPPAGTVKYSSNEKNQIMTFFARQLLAIGLPSRPSWAAGAASPGERPPPPSFGLRAGASAKRLG